MSTSSSAIDFGHEFETVSLVVLYEPMPELRLSLGPEFVEKLEEEMGAPVNLTQSLDALFSFSIPRHQLTGTLAPGRVEVHRQKPDFFKILACEWLGY